MIFSLDFVNPDRNVIEDRLEAYDGRTKTKVRSYDLAETVYGIYAKTNEMDESESIEYDFDAAFAEMDPDVRVIVRYILDVFEGVREEKRAAESAPLDAYKGIDLKRLPDALERVDWSGTVS